MDDVRDDRKCRVICNNERNGVSPCQRFVFKCVSESNVSTPRSIWVVVTAIGKVVYKLISMKYVTSMLYG